LSLSDIAAQIEVSDADLRSYYEQERERFQTEEERRVRHILINVESGELQAAQARADEVLSRLNAGEDFASLAQELSDDAGTRAQGGELGWIARGTLPGPFEDALYSMDLDEVRGPVQTDFGLHIMQLEELREGDEQPFEAISDELRDQYQTELADQSFYDRANELADKAFEAYDELATVAAETNLPLKVATDFSRAGDPALFANSGPVIQAAFDPELLEQGINSPLIELSDNDVLVLRVSEHKLPEPLILEEVQDEIRADLTRFAAEELAADAADTFVAAVEVGMESQENTEAHGGRWFETRMVERSDDQVPTELIAAAFDMAEPMAGQPERQRVPLASGDQAFVVLHSVVAGRPEDVAREERDQRQRDLANQAAGIELSSYVGDVRNQATVRIPQEILNPQL
jgi:peptidyl-prolyl cis-trans isomerase D